MEKLLKRESARNGNQDVLKDKLDVRFLLFVLDRRQKLLFTQEIAKENRQLKNNLADNHLEMTLIKAELAELRSEYESAAMAVAGADPAGADAENMQRQLQLL